MLKLFTGFLEDVFKLENSLKTIDSLLDANFNVELITRIFGHLNTVIWSSSDNNLISTTFQTIN